MKKVFGKISSRLFIYSYVIALQYVLVVLFIVSLCIISDKFCIIMRLAGIITAIKIIFSGINSNFRILWVFLLLTFPSITFFLYMLSSSGRFRTERYRKYACNIKNYNDCETAKKLFLCDKKAYSIYKYINSINGSYIYENTEIQHFPLGEIFFRDYIKELEKAEKSIYLEYFIIGDGDMWNKILDILKKKSQSGIDVRIIYDGMGTVNFFKKNYFRSLEKYGIKTAVFNEFYPSADILFKCRDHRKITVIDNSTAYTGGLNISDEYINTRRAYGYWKDYTFRIKGDAVNEYSRMFIENWNFCSEDKLCSEIKFEKSSKIYNDGFSVPFGDIPCNENPVGKNVYMGIIENAENYIYIITPYLILDDEMRNLLKYKSYSGIDIRIITPHIPDKKYVHAVTRSNYDELIKAGVKIYEYTNGFIHAKSVISDDNYAMTGTVNFDYRSFHMLFENSIFIYKSNVLYQLKSDFIYTLEESTEITDEFFQNKSVFQKIIYSVLRFFSAMM